MRGNPVVPSAISRGHSTDPPRPMETGRAEGHDQARITRVSRCRTRKGTSHRMVVNHPRRRTKSNGLGRIFGSRSNTRAQPPSADPHAVVVWEGPRSNPGPYPDLVML